MHSASCLDMYDVPCASYMMLGVFLFGYLYTMVLFCLCITSRRLQRAVLYVYLPMLHQVSQNGEQLEVEQCAVTVDTPFLSLSSCVDG